ncbi:uncharacterized protein LOC130451982 [Diorhabda sublineata]|uniref:uncharacterized protein LOC130451982 n=1 Tax=Diorhabda sublineata TaxID=1163346 RepID=UPI0024E172F3|nr:uncharacterized protein LOC130451982 [Diorhabda sublineata]
MESQKQKLGYNVEEKRRTVEEEVRRKEEEEEERRKFEEELILRQKKNKKVNRSRDLVTQQSTIIEEGKKEEEGEEKEDTSTTDTSEGDILRKIMFEEVKGRKSKKKGKGRNRGKFEEWASLAKEEWEEEVYSKTVWHESSVIEALKRRETCVILGKLGNNGETADIIRKTKEEIWTVWEELGKGEWESIENKIKTKKNEIRWYNHIAKVSDEEEGRLETFNICQQISEEINSGAEKEVAIVIGEGLDKILIRKIIEFVNSKKEIKYKIISKIGEKEKEKEKRAKLTARVSGEEGGISRRRQRSHDRKRKVVDEECTSSSGEDDNKIFDEEKKTVEDDLARELFEQELIQKHKEMVNKSFASVRKSTMMEEEVEEEKESSDEFDFRKTDLFSILLGIEKKVTTPYWCQSTNKEEKKAKKNPGGRNSPGTKKQPQRLLNESSARSNRSSRALILKTKILKGGWGK